MNGTSDEGICKHGGKLQAASWRQNACSRRIFMGMAAAGAVGLALPRLFGQENAVKGGMMPQIGADGPPEDASSIAKAGCSYYESRVGTLLLPDKSEEEFRSILKTVRSSGLKIPVCNRFYPAELKLVGPEPRLKEALDYAKVVFARAAEAGVEVIVLGSGGARRIPDGFSAQEARKQFVAYCLFTLL